jgi:hypothetical protein
MPSPQELASTPSWYPHQLNVADERVLLVERSEEDFRAASFLDDRSLKPEDRREIVKWSELEAALPASARRDVQYIFHIGHVGSTLISRLLGELPEVLSLREPLLLRSFAEMSERQEGWMAPRLDTLTALLSRTFRADQRAIVKATSFSSEIAPALVPAGSRALLLYTSAPRYLENIFAGDASRQETHVLASARLQRLNRRLGEPGWKIERLGEPQKAALGWACEMAALAEAERRLPGATLWADFDSFLARPARQLAEIAAFFGHPTDAATAERLATGPLMGRYSKALEYEYTPQLRAEVLAESRVHNRGAIDAAMAWLHETARRHPTLAECLARAD